MVFPCGEGQDEKNREDLPQRSFVSSLIVKPSFGQAGTQTIWQYGPAGDVLYCVVPCVVSGER